jgi:transcriptional regulator with XRE-family HTH domain
MSVPSRAPTWKELDARRAALPKRLSRAEMARRAGISESTITKALQSEEDVRPRKALRDQVELVLEAAKIAAEAGL